VLSKLASLAMSPVLGAIFVGSLYIGTKGEQDRDDPIVIKSRFLRTGVSCLISLGLSYLLLPSASFSHFLELSGISATGLIPALTLPLLITASLFFGPLVYDFVQGTAVPDFTESFNLQLQTVRSLVVAPIAEEIVFRSALVPLMLASGWSDAATAMLSPLGFGLAHAHHVIAHQVG